jgi:glycosyltransferase involved in cell wall biosynthesis
MHKYSRKEKVSVCLPVWNGADTILETIQSILNQTFKDFELVIVDNASTDNTVNIVKSVDDKRIRMYRNKRNIGGGGNFNECKKRATGDILFYISADDIADINALKKVYEAFQISEDIGIVTRPYYWFEEDALKAVRVTKQFSKNQLVSINSPYEKIKNVIASADQVSGMGFRKKYMNFPFGKRYFVEMASIVPYMLKNCKAVILKDNIVAVRTRGSGYESLVLKSSPMMAWYNLIETAYAENKFRKLRQYLIRNFVANNYVGLVQIKNFGSYQSLFKEIYYLIKLRWLNIFNPRFWFFSLGTIIMPRFILRRLVVIYKNKINSQLLKNVKINLGGKI